MRKPKQLQLFRRGGKRKNAGRKNRSGMVAHMKRPNVNAKTPVHLTMRLKKGFSGLRSPKLHKEMQRSLKCAARKGLATLHYSLQSNHIHIIGESVDNRALAKGMNSFAARFGKIVRRKIGGRGSVFAGRYHLTPIKSPRQMRNTLAYVMLNKSKHQEWEPDYDDYSTARHFRGWPRLIGQARARFLGEGLGEPLPDHLSEPKSWLAREGWRKAV